MEQLIEQFNLITKVTKLSIQITGTYFIISLQHAKVSLQNFTYRVSQKRHKRPLELRLMSGH